MKVMYMGYECPVVGVISVYFPEVLLLIVFRGQWHFAALGECYPIL